MAYTLAITRSARKEIERLDGRVRRRVVDAIDEILDDPYRQGVKRLSGGAAFRYRVGNYRIVYTVDGRRVTVTVIRVRHRSKVYR